MTNYGDSQGASASEIKRAKAKAVGGKRKRCIKGKSCSATCVQRADACLVEMPDSSGNSVSKARNMLLGSPKPKSQESLKREIAALNQEAQSKLKALNELKAKHKELEDKAIKLKVAKGDKEEIKQANKEFKAIDKKLKADTDNLYKLVDSMGKKKDELAKLGSADKAKQVAEPKKMPPPPPPKVAPSGNDIFSRLARKEEENWETDGLAKADKVNWSGLLSAGRRIGKGEYAEASVVSADKVGVPLRLNTEGGIILKKGEIGDFESEALSRAGKAGIAPQLIASRVSFKKAFADDSSLYNGLVVMERVSGSSLLSAMQSGTADDKYDTYWSTKAKLHKLGIAHNDSHAGNFIIDPEGKGKFIDFGLSVISHKNALGEALGGPTGSDRQSSPREGAVFNRIVKNLAAVRSEMAKDGYSSDEIKRFERTGNSATQLNGGPWGKLTPEQTSRYLNLLYEGV
jgi:serine/threonine protein kinase